MNKVREKYMHTSKRIQKKMLFYSYICKMLGIISEQEYKSILSHVQSGKNQL
jgi:hypothetical protein